MKQPGFEYVARRFLNTDHEYRDYIRLMLYWALCENEEREEGERLLRERWEEIDRRGWENRLEQGDKSVWREMLTGYYLGEINAGEIFDPLSDRAKFDASLLSRAGFPFSGMQCEAYFYDALFQHVSGNPFTRQKRALERLNAVQDTNYVFYYEYHMARYLLSQFETRER